MARVVVSRDGQVVDRFVVDPSTLRTHDLRIGRDQGSDIVLDDPEKTVSRQHAELRFDQGEYVLFDLGSPNGTWVGDERVQRVVLTGGGRVRIGPYELSLEETDAKQAQMPAASETEAGNTSPMVKPVGDVLPVTTDSPVSQPLGARLGSRNKPKPAGSGGVPQPGAIAWLARQPKPVVFGGAFAVIVLVLGLRVMLSPVEDGAVTPEVVPLSETASSNAELIAELLAAARAALSEGDFDDAIEYLDRVLLIDRSHPDALDIKARVEQGFREAENQPVPVEVLDEDSVGAVEAAAAEADRAEAERVRVQRAAAQRASEREAELEGQLAETRALLDAENFAGAISVLERVLEGNPDHQVAGALMALAKDERGAAARAAFDRAVRAEGESNWEEAIEEYEQAQALDGTMFGVEAAVRRVRERMAEAGADAYKRARQYDALGRIPEAIALYERAIRLLPSDHAERQPAQERFRELSSGAR